MSPPTDTVRTSDSPVRASANGAGASVIQLRERRVGPPTAGGIGVGWAAVIVTATIAFSPLASGYFDFSVWGPLALGAMVLLIVVARAGRPSFTRPGLVAAASLGVLFLLSAASMLWAESKESAWTSVNRLGLYAVVFAITVLAVRQRRVARLIVALLGAAALVTSIWFTVAFLFGGGQHAFLTRRLNLPIGYINGTAGLLVMGLWPWMAYAETSDRRALRAGALGAATLIASVFVLTESRAVVPATLLSAVVVLICAPGRTRRAANLLIVLAAVACTLPWTLAVYSTGGAASRPLPPPHGLLRSAAAAAILAALAAGCLRDLSSRAAARLDPRRRALITRRAGAGLLAVTVLAVVGAVGAGVGTGWFAREYRAFTALHVNQNASVRFVDAGGFRYDLWRVAVREFRSHPFGGVGAGNYDTEYYRLRKNPEYVVQPHSIELQMAAELGIGGLVALLAFCAAIFRAGFARAGTLAAGDPLIRIAALGVFTAWLVDTSVDWLYDIPGLAAAAIVAAALLVVPGEAPAASTTDPRPRRGRAAQVALVTGFAAIALLAASVGRQYAASRYMVAGQHEVASAPRQAIDKLREAARLDPYSLQTLYLLSAAYARLDDYQRARDALLLAAAREPHNYVPPALLGDLATRRGDRPTALADYRRALSLNPGDPAMRQTVAEAAR